MIIAVISFYSSKAFDSSLQIFTVNHNNWKQIELWSQIKRQIQNRFTQSPGKKYINIAETRRFE